jgi:aspartyl-tRNA(Asn)/glutamyl-tRNA(Gln) amidotransferase subunit B
MDKYKLTVGLEIHAELKTLTKMFCSCRNDGDEKRPNVNICPICLGHPGTLPVPNREAIRNVLKVGVAIGGVFSNISEFDRKNYFYPDIPKGYQISQYKYPLVSGGKLLDVDITRVHLEEDTAKSSHPLNEDYSLVDFNRAGVPLLELVTEPVIKNPSQAGDFARELQLLFQYLCVSDANMEKGEMRVEANISVSDSSVFGTKVEVKNLNSFKSVERAIEYEYKRQVDQIESGGKIVQETRGWDESLGKTFSQREKESSHDYRYFPDPDLTKIVISDSPYLSIDAIKKELKETPLDKRNRFRQSFGIKESDIEFYINNIPLSDLFEEASKTINSGTGGIQILSNYISSDLPRLLAGDKTINPVFLAEVVDMFIQGKISSRGVKDLLPKIIEEQISPKELVLKYGLVQESSVEAITKIVDKVLGLNEKVVEEYRSGKLSSIQFLVGQCMKESKGSGNPVMFKEVIESKLASIS